MSGVTVMAVVVASCSSSSGSGWSGSAATTSSAHAPAPTTSAQPLKLLRPLKPLKQPSARRGAPHANATLVRFNTADGISLDGAIFGTGPVGVVVAHEYDNDLCGACPFANYPAKRGLRVFAVDVRCFGRSACPRGDAAGRVVDDLVAAVAELRQTWGNQGGARRRVDGRLGGADRRQASRASSRRGSELSGQAKPTSLLRIPLNGRGAVQQLTVPTMFVVASYDQDASVYETRVMYQANKATDERLLLLPGQFEGFGGWMVLHNTSGGFSTTTTVGELVAARSPDAVQRMFSGVCHNVSHMLRPAGRNSGTGRAHAAGIWGRMGGPTVLAEAVELVGRGNRDRRDPLPGCVGSARGRRGRRHVRGAGWADRRLDDHVFREDRERPGPSRGRRRGVFRSCGRPA